MSDYQAPRFKASFLLPKYWLLWLGLGLFRLILLLPYPVLLKIGRQLSKIFMHTRSGQKRCSVAKRNLELCFPNMTKDERERILQENMESVGIAVIETGMAWFWSDKRVLKISKIVGLENLTSQKPSGVIFVGVHFLTLELGARIVGLHAPGYGVYRPNNNPALDWVQYHGRIRSNKGLIDRKDMQQMYYRLNTGEAMWYAPDHDYGPRNMTFAPLFAVEKAATTNGSYILLKNTENAKVVPFTPLRNRDNSGYTVTISPAVDFSHAKKPSEVAILMNKVVEDSILSGVEQYMWLHRRFKTRPKGEASLYSD